MDMDDLVGMVVDMNDMVDIMNMVDNERMAILHKAHSYSKLSVDTSE